MATMITSDNTGERMSMSLQTLRMCASAAMALGTMGTLAADGESLWLRMPTRKGLTINVH